MYLHFKCRSSSMASYSFFKFRKEKKKTTFKVLYINTYGSFFFCCDYPILK